MQTIVKKGGNVLKSAVDRLLKDLILLTWLVSLAASLGSLVLSEVFDLVPCTLCWYQRAMMFPLAFIFGVGVYRKDSDAVYYALPLSLVGAGIALYHSLLQWGVIKEAVTACSIDSSCAVPQINWLGFITIPFMSLVSFTVIGILSVWQIQRARNGQKR